MRKAVFAFSVLLLLSLADAGAAHAAAVVLVAEDGGYDAPTVQTVRTIASTELRVQGVPVIDDPSYRATVAPTDEVLRGVVALGADRLFVLRLGRLGEKVMISLEELAPPDPRPVFAATLMAEDIEESDTVVPRLVRAVLGRVSAEKTASIGTMTAQETEPFRKKPGEGLFMLGMCLVPLGSSLGWSYEAATWRLGAMFQGAEDDPPYFGFEGAWVPLQGDISPYVGGGLGIVWPANGNDDGDGRLGAKVDLGVEFLRLRGTRLLVGVSAIIPFESIEGTDDVNPQVWIRLGL